MSGMQKEAPFVLGHDAAQRRSSRLPLVLNQHYVLAFHQHVVLGATASWLLSHAQLYKCNIVVK